MPSNPSVNSSKSDRIPDLDLYLPKLSTAHHKAIKTYCSLGECESALEDYVSLGYSIRANLGNATGEVWRTVSSDFFTDGADCL